MGHQILFYLADKDILGLKDNILEANQTVILLSRSRGPFSESVPSIDLITNGKRQYFFYLVREVDLDSVITKEVPGQGYWTIDDLCSPVIELTLGRIEKDVIRRGRLYYNDNYYDSTGKLVNKSSDFLKWANRIFASAKSWLTYDREVSSYVGKEAQELRKSGIKFVQF